MPGDDLNSIPGLLDNHRRALDSKLGITGLRALADADQRAIYTTLQNVRPVRRLRVSRPGKTMPEAGSPKGQSTGRHGRLQRHLW